MTGLVFDPLVSWPVLVALLVFASVLLAVALWRGLTGWWLRGLTAAVVLTALANPALQEEDRGALSDIVILVVDESASQRLGDRRRRPQRQSPRSRRKWRRWTIPNCGSCGSAMARMMRDHSR
jgi:hypothetical protein